jgi:opacity protein-like surface antigen
MKYLFLSLAALALTGTAAAHSVSVNAGTCIVDRNNIEHENCEQVAVSGELSLTSNLTAQVRFNKLEADVIGFNGGINTTGEYEREEVTVGVVYNPWTFGRVEPFIGAHFGKGDITTRLTSQAANDPTITLSADGTNEVNLWAVRAGSDYNLTRNVAIFAEVAYTQYQDNGIDVRFETAGGVTGELSPGTGVLGEDRSYDLNVGLRFKF